MFHGATNDLHVRTSRCLFVVVTVSFESQWLPCCLVGSSLSLSCCTSSQSLYHGKRLCCQHAHCELLRKAPVESRGKEFLPCTSRIWFLKALINDDESSCNIVTRTLGALHTASVCSFVSDKTFACFSALTLLAISCMCGRSPAGARSKSK